MSVALVTGASGFIGRHAVSELLEHGFVVHTVSRHPLPHIQANWHKVDLFDVTARRALIETVRPSHLLHLAWETRHGYYWEAPENLDWVAATLDLLGTFRRCGGARAVLAGTCAEYDWRPEALKDGVCCEWGTPRVPTTFYGKAKSATYELTAAFAERNGPSLAWARIFFAYGAFESENRLIPAVVRALLAGRPIPLGDGRMVRDLLDVRDVGTAVSTLLTSSVEGPVNIGSGIGVSIREIAHGLAEVIQREESLLRFGALSTNPDEPACLLANATRLRDEVGFRPRYDLRVGLADAVRWWKGKQQEG
jgi:nucleoside-diphosphate-sugar epimerase